MFFFCKFALYTTKRLILCYAVGSVIGYTDEGIESPVATEDASQLSSSPNAAKTVQFADVTFSKRSFPSKDSKKVVMTHLK